MDISSITHFLTVDEQLKIVYDKIYYYSWIKWICPYIANLVAAGLYCWILDKHSNGSIKHPIVAAVTAFIVIHSVNFGLLLVMGMEEMTLEKFKSAQIAPACSQLSGAVRAGQIRWIDPKTMQKIEDHCDMNEFRLSANDATSQLKFSE